MARKVFKHGSLAISVPPEWVDGSQVIFLGPEDDGFRPNLVFSQESAKVNETAEAFAERMLPNLETALHGYKVVGGKKATFGRNEGFLREHQFKMESTEISQLQFYVILDGEACTFTFTHRRERFEGMRKLAEDLFAAATLSVAPTLPDVFDLSRL